MLIKRTFTPCFLALVLWGTNAGAEKIPYAQSKIEPPTPEWISTIERNAPATPAVAAPKRKLLVFSLHTGYNHLVIPHVNRVFEILGSKSGAFDAEITTDIERLSADSLSACDVLVLNNNCSKGPRRNLLLDVLESDPKYVPLSPEQRQAKASFLEKAMINFVAGGKGLVVIHGAPTLVNNSREFTEMIGCAFDYHPPNQEVTLRPVDTEHPLVAAFRGKGVFIHRDEPYCFTGAYEKFDFLPLLYMETEGMRDPRGQVGDKARYVAWIKPYGKGRVFYCSPSHFPESYQSPTMLKFILDGTQYAAGDLECDDSTPAQLGRNGQQEE